ncbi:pentatricopeptide repeat-containing protein At3g16610-like [Cucurbita pepo subsp. pepo]|uniref:pentatricopeptide repeat-containing protein At3g16610-like n=1 Tax=Cucurbita pepo subsp. pepo TaxID=3664 RepID=UPI000C9D9B1B|nr:pentatricopeptide repeat-containing protein At3g16610-like [Cucurbita pepo subsp. pepo]
MSLSINFVVAQPVQSIVFPSRTPNGQIRNSSLTTTHSATQKAITTPGIKIPNSVSVDKSNSRLEIQPLVDLLRGCVDARFLKQAKTVHGFLLKSKFSNHDSLVLLNHVADAYSKCSDIDAACRLFDKMSQRNIFSWTVIIAGLAKNGLFHDGFEFFCEMQSQDIFPDQFAYSGVLQICIGLESIELGKMVHAQIVIRGFASHTFVSTALLNMYAKLQKIDDSYEVFNTMTEVNVVSWNAMISGFTSNGLYSDAFDHFLRMKGEGVTPDAQTFISIAKAIGMLRDVNKAKEISRYASELGMDSNTLVGTGLIDMHSKCGSLQEARSIFDSHFTNCRVNGPWNAMISGYLQSEFNEKALELFAKMCLNNVHLDRYTYCSVFNAIAALKCLSLGKKVHARAIKSGLEVNNISISNAVANAYAKCGSLEDLRKVFYSMEERDLVSWTTLVTAYSQCSEWDKAIEIFSNMREEGFAPNQFAFSSVLVSCASLCLLEYGQQVHGVICKVGLDMDKCIQSALIDMYAKCGSLAEAKKVFDKISDADTISWTAIIAGHAQHGMVDDALQLFRRMDQLGVEPNAVTFLCVLFACSHGGLVEEGLQYFKLMKETYGLVPGMEHYSCIVDLLSRVGRLNDAMEFISKMPIEPNEMVWQTLLGACRVHGNVELGELAARKIRSFKAENSATYVLLSNTYIESGSYKDGLSLRNVMKEQGVKKEPGCSWIAVNGTLHKFYAGDQQHPEKDKIYAKLEELRLKVNSSDDVPDLSYEL